MLVRSRQEKAVRDMRQDRSRNKQSFLHGALILAAATVVVKLIGAVFKIPLSILIGGEGMGYFTTAYGLYNPIVALAVAGLPVAVSKVVAANAAAGRYRDVRRIFSLSKLFLAAAGLAGLGIMLLGSGAFVRLSGNPGAFWSVVAISPALFFSCVMAAYRGYYEGLRNMYPTGASQVLEAAMKLVLGLGLSCAAIYYGRQDYRHTGLVFGQFAANQQEADLLVLQFSAAAAVAGVTLSTCFGMLFLIIRHKILGGWHSKAGAAPFPSPSGEKGSAQRTHFHRDPGVPGIAGDKFDFHCGSVFRDEPAGNSDCIRPKGDPVHV